MEQRTVRFNYGLFFNAMVNLIGREPDTSHRYGLDGYYSFRYEARDENEVRQLQEALSVLRDWLSLFELKPFHSRCEYGRLPHPNPGEEQKDYLDIVISHPVEREKGK